MTNTLAFAIQALERGDLAAAERAVQERLAKQPDDAGALHVLGIVRFQQQRVADAVPLLERAARLTPGQPQLLRHHAAALSHLGRHTEAAAILIEVARLVPADAEVWFELGKQQHMLGDHAAAETAYRKMLALAPQHPAAFLALGSLLLETGRAAEAEAMLAQGLAHHPQMAGMMGEILIHAQRLQGRKQEALATLVRVQALAPELRDALEIQRAHLLDELFRFDEALAAMETVLQRDPANAAMHDAYNDLLYRLGRESEFLASYDRAPPDVSLRLGKATFLRHARRAQEAHDIYADLLAREPGNIDAVTGAADALSETGRDGEAIRLLETALARRPGEPRLTVALATAALRGRDPEKSAALAQQSLAAAPGDHLALALLSSAWRLMGDERDEVLSGYDNLVQVIDLEAPEGFCDMTEFNQTLAAMLERQHPPTREFLSQSLRGGTQAGNLFEGGHDLVGRLKQRLNQGVGRYIDALARDDRHPLLSRRRGAFSYAGSWSSRLRDCGFHVNHIHPEGWISCCYYVGVPEAVADENAKQGWIKFGEPAFDVGLSFRRAIKPKPGRLVLFPSYMWHGTIPFHADAVRTTIAFDVVPNGGAPGGRATELPPAIPLLRRGG